MSVIERANDMARLPELSKINAMVADPKKVEAEVLAIADKWGWTPDYLDRIDYLTAKFLPKKDERS